MLIVAKSRQVPRPAYKPRYLHAECVVLVTSHVGSRRIYGPDTQMACMRYINNVKFNEPTL